MPFLFSFLSTAVPVLFDDWYRHLSLHMKYTPPLPPCMTQAHAATVVGNLATSRQSVCEALANDNTITSLVGLLVDAGASAFESSGGRDPYNNAGFVVASVCGCLMSVSEGGGAAAVAHDPAAVRVIAQSMVAAARAAMRDIQDHVALRCVSSKPHSYYSDAADIDALQLLSYRHGTAK